MYRVYLPKINLSKAAQAYFAGNKNKKTGLIIGTSQFLFTKTYCQRMKNIDKIRALGTGLIVH